MLKSVKFSENEAGMISKFNTPPDMQKMDFTEKAIDVVYEQLMEHPSAYHFGYIP